MSSFSCTLWSLYHSIANEADIARCSIQWWNSSTRLFITIWKVVSSFYWYTQLLTVVHCKTVFTKFITHCMSTAVCSLASVCLGAFPYLRKATFSFVISACFSVTLSVRPLGKTRLQLDGFLWNLIFESSSKFCPEILSFFRIWEEYRMLYMKACVYSWQYISLSAS